MNTRIIRIQYISVIAIIAMAVMLSCRKNGVRYDASGTFESREVIISSEANGKILSFPVNEGDRVSRGQVIARVDSTGLLLQMEQSKEAVRAIDQKQNSPQPQISVLNKQLAVAEAQEKTLAEQLRVLEKEQKRVRAMFEGEAATAQQLDEVSGKVDVLKQQLTAAAEQKSVIVTQIKSAREQVAIQNRGITSEKAPMEKKVSQIADQLLRTTILAPENGTVLTKYAEAGEFTAIGKPLLKIADLDEMVLRAYITGDQLSSVKAGDKVDVFVDQGSEAYKSYQGKVLWISDKAEFTPKTIQTKDERANLVYAMKVSVKNDGMIKLGMYGEVTLPKQGNAK